MPIKINLREFSKEDIPIAIANWLESIIGQPYEPYQIIQMIKDNAWLKWCEGQVHENS